MKYFPTIALLKFADLFDDHLAETVGKLWKVSRGLYNCHNEPAMVGHLSYSIVSDVNTVDHAGLLRILSGSVFVEPFNCTRSLHSGKGMNHRVPIL